MQVVSPHCFSSTGLILWAPNVVSSRKDFSLHYTVPGSEWFLLIWSCDHLLPLYIFSSAIRGVRCYCSVLHLNVCLAWLCRKVVNKDLSFLSRWGIRCSSREGLLYYVPWFRQNIELITACVSGNDCWISGFRRSSFIVSHNIFNNPGWYCNRWRRNMKGGR